MTTQNILLPLAFLALLFGLACALYLAGGMARTMLTNVPMNEALAAMRRTGGSGGGRRTIWADYSAGMAGSGIPPEPSSAPACCCSSAPRS